MDVCRRCNHRIKTGQKTWRLGTDVEHEDCYEAAPIEARIEQLRDVVRALNGVRTDLVKLGIDLVANHLHHRPNAHRVDVADDLKAAAERMRGIIALLLR